MRVLESQVDIQQPSGVPNGQPAYPSFSQRLNRAIGVNVFGATAFAGQAANVINQGDI